MPDEWWTQPFCGFDVESTGVNVEEDRIVSACFVTITPTPEPPWKVDARNWLIDPGVPIPDGAARIHGITTERARAEGRPPAEALYQIRMALAAAMEAGMPIVGTNLCYDMTIFDRELCRHGHSEVSLLDCELGPCVDVYVLDKEVDRFRKGKRTLDALCRHYHVRLDGAHDAAFDAVAACRLAWRIVTGSNVLMGMSAWELHRAQVGWRRDQQIGLREHFLKTDRKRDAAGIVEAWPIHPRPAG